ncbi:MAG: hypothetical protein P1V35_14665 [Planctomycetota bacterium]|nr:hypothetical protein [Planctomycetota bacterium]
MTLDWIITLIAGAVGGNIGGALFKNLSLGTVLNSIAGILGGAGGMSLMNSLNATSGSELLNQLGGGAVGGTVVMAVVGLIKKVMGGGK